MKNINKLTQKEAEEIVSIINPFDGDYGMVELIKEPVKFKDGGTQISLGGHVVGIKYRGGFNGDGFLLPFTNTKVVKWLYNNGYDITELLEQNDYLSEMEEDFENFSFMLELKLSGYAENKKPNPCWDIVKELLDEYWFKDYE